MQQRDLKRAPQRATLNAVYYVTNSVQYFDYRAHRQAFLLMFKESTMGKKGRVTLNPRWLSSDVVCGFANNPAGRRGMTTEIWAIAVIFLSGSGRESNYKVLVNAGRESGKALGFYVSPSFCEGFK